MTLDKARRGQIISIISLPDMVRAQAIRFGLTEGTQAVCEEVLPGGPVILRKNRQEIAIGRRLAEKIAVEVLP